MVQKNRLTFQHSCFFISVKQGLQFDSDEDKKKQCYSCTVSFKIKCTVLFYDLLLQLASTLLPIFKLHSSYTDHKTLNELE